MSLEKNYNSAKPAASMFNQNGNTQSPLFGTLSRGFNNVLRELEQKKPQLDDLVRTAESLRESPIKQQIPAKVTQLREHWEDTSTKVLTRKGQLEELYVDNQELEGKRREVEAWLARMEAWQDRMQPVAPDLLESQVRENKSFHAEVHQYRARIEDFNNLTQELISSYPSDDASKIKKIAESINQRFCMLNNYAMVRGKEIHGGLSTSNSLLSNLDEFSTWMSQTEMKLEALHKQIEKMPAPSSTQSTLAALNPSLVSACQDLQDEVEQHRDMYLSLDSTGKKLVSGLDTQEDATILARRLEEMNQRWGYLKAKSMAIRSRLENTGEDWSSLLVSLRELSDWVAKQEADLLGLGPVGGDENVIRKQQDDTRVLRRVMYEKRPVIENKLLSGRQVLASEPTPSDTSDSDMSRETESTSGGSGAMTADQEQTSKCIRREVAKLSDKWSALLTQLDLWQRRLDDTLPKVHTFQASLEAVLAQLCDAEHAQKSLTNTGAGEADPATFRNQLKTFSASLAPLQRVVEDINDQASDFTANNVALSRQILQRLEDINTRWKLVQLGLDDHYKRLNEVRGKDRMPHTQDFLSVAVQAPWARAISQNGVPYYINHQTETTHWDHPEMVSTFKSLMAFNTIRFSAYRTAMKIRELQKKLSLHLLSLNVAIEAFDAHGLRGQNERMLDVADIVTILGSLYETISASNPTTVNVPLCLDLTLNWLLNVYDCQRTGQIRVLSFKIAITIMCKGPLEEKYRYMFRLIADQARKSNQRKLALLLSDCIQVPRVLGEVQAFGGTNVEPSVRSCFEKAGGHEFIEALNFLSWMKQEPQSMVWLPVLHRFTAAETAKHQAKCNICKQNPILGFRYRCLKCFNFDMCQECFFAGKGGRYKSHKMTHPMQEYCTNTTSGEDVRDFTRLLRNKLMSSRKKKSSSSRLGYLPVQTLDPENLIPDSPSLSPGRSVSRQETSERLDILSSRLSEIETRSGSDESASRQVTPQQHSEPSRVSTGSPLTKDEHSLIAVYCQKLMDGQLSHLIPDSPMQVALEIDAEQRKELEFMIKELEQENANLKEEYNHLKIAGCQMPGMTLNPPDVTLGTLGPGLNAMNSTEAEMLAEAAMLREHRARLEGRMGLLEEHNRQLESQLGKLKQILEPGGCAANKTGTLNTKSVTASQLAQDSPVLPHKMNNGYPGSQPPAAPGQPVKIPPAVPPRTRDGSVTRAQFQTITSLTNGLATIKRSSLGRAEGQQMLEEVFRASTLSRRGGGGADSGRIPFRREASVPRSGVSNWAEPGGHGGQGSAANWSDSLPRKDLFLSSQTNSLPRRDKAGLGRPEPSKMVPAGPGPLPGDQGDRLTGDTREPSRERSNPFRDHILGADKRSSTGNLFFTDQFDNHPWEAPPELQPPGHKAGPAWPPQRRRNLSSLSGGQADQAGTKEDREDRDPAATLQAMAGNVGKELNQLISLMNNEDAENDKTKK